MHLIRYTAGCLKFSAGAILGEFQNHYITDLNMPGSFTNEFLGGSEDRKRAAWYDDFHWIARSRDAALSHG